MTAGSAFQAFVASLRSELDAEHVTALEACLDCRQCGSACAWYLGTGEEALHPKHKTDFIRALYRQHGTTLGWLGRRLGVSSPFDEDRLRAALPSFWHCTTCGRCTLACPLGLSNRHVIRLARGCFARSGLVLDNPILRQVYEGSRDQRHSFALSRDRIHLRIGFLAQHAGVDIPFDLTGAEYLFVCTAVGNTRFPDLGIQVPALFNAAGIDYTFSSRITDTGTDIEHVLVHRELSRTMLLEVEAEALRLHSGTLVIAECGCDVRTFYVDATRLLGRPLRVRVQSLDSLLLRLLASGALPARPVTEAVTLHDPCKVTRLSGMGDLIRDLLSRVATEVIEMSPNRERNHCCNGGTGPLRLPENAGLRRRISRIKADQIRATGATRVVTPCAVCMLTLEDVCQTYGLSRPDHRRSFLLFEVVHEAVSQALRERGQLDLMRAPAAFLHSPDLRETHSLASRVCELARQETFAADLAWLKADPLVQKYIGRHAGAAAAFEAWSTGLLPSRPREMRT